MKKRLIILAVLALALLLCACRQGNSNELSDGTYNIEVTLSGGSGKASIKAAQITKAGDDITADITWSSSNYDYMIVNGEELTPVSIENGSEFVFPISGLDEEIAVQADTVAMSTPHLIDYTLTFNSDSIEKAE